jgi:hypothetical protein
MTDLRKAMRSLQRGVLISLVASCSAPGFAQENAADNPESTFTLGGYVRAAASFNLQNQPETVGDDKNKLSMLRGTVYLDADWKPSSSMRFKAIGRIDREYKTDYLRSLEAPPSTTLPGSTASVFSTNGGGGIGGIMENYNQAELREVWGEFTLNNRVKLKLGKQQIVWGETDFFRAMDVVHGFDYRWRSFLEVENEELRKPLVIARMTVQVPEAEGSLDMFIRPGWDRDQDIGNTFDLAGGRWASQPFRGASFMYASAYNYRSKGADVDDVTGGVRWQGTIGDFNYSLAAVRTFSNDPIFNPCAATLSLLGPSASSFTAFNEAPKACGPISTNPYGNPLQFGDWIFPTTDIFGFTASTYSEAIDAVLSTEVVYQKDRAFNYGFVNGRFGPNITPGAFGVTLKNTLTTMFRIDKNVDLTNLIGTSRPSFGSIQLFNTRVLDFDSSEELVQSAFMNRARHPNSALLTVILGMNYSNDRINPTIAAGWDISNGGGFFIPSVEFVLGDNWRVRSELDLFFPNGNEKRRFLNPATGQYEEQGKGAALIGYFAKANQLALRVTRQF